MIKREQDSIDFTNLLSRRDILKKAAIGAAVFGALPDYMLANSDNAVKQSEFDFPIVDYHVHLYGNMQMAMSLSEKQGVKFGIVEHPGRGYPLVNDEALKKYIDTLKKYPVCIGLQPIYPDWAKDFSTEMLSKLDYILMDALTLPEKDGRWLPIWRPDTKVEDKDSFMKRYVDFNMQILTTQPIDIFGWPTYLPQCIAEDYDTLWTDELMQKIIDTAIKKDIAIEINEAAKVPKLKFVKMAKEARAKFTFGTDSRNSQAGVLTYGLKIAKEAGLTKENMFVLKPDSKKAVQRANMKKENSTTNQ